MRSWSTPGCSRLRVAADSSTPKWTRLSPSSRCCRLCSVAERVIAQVPVCGRTGTCAPPSGNIDFIFVCTTSLCPSPFLAAYQTQRMVVRTHAIPEQTRKAVVGWEMACHLGHLLPSSPKAVNTETFASIRASHTAWEPSTDLDPQSTWLVNYRQSSPKLILPNHPSLFPFV